MDPKSFISLDKASPSVVSKYSKFYYPSEPPSNSIQLSTSFKDDVSEPELRYVLSNLLSDEDVADLEAKYKPSLCEYCSKENVVPKTESCCEQQEMDKYIKEVKSKQIEERISTYFLLRPRRINAVSHADMEELKRFMMEDNYRRGMNIELPSNPNNFQTYSDESLVKIKLKKGSIKAFQRIKQKMENFKVYWPQLFDSQMDPIHVWGNMIKDRADKENQKDDDNEQNEDVICPLSPSDM